MAERCTRFVCLGKELSQRIPTHIGREPEGNLPKQSPTLIYLPPLLSSIASKMGTVGKSQVRHNWRGAVAYRDNKRGKRLTR